MDNTLHIVGGGLAGSEAAWQAATRGISVVIHEMRPDVATFAHKTENFAEMVCLLRKLRAGLTETREQSDDGKTMIRTTDSWRSTLRLQKD